MKVKRYEFDFCPFSIYHDSVECDNGRFVEYKDYEHLSNYCDRLVEVGRLPCLPKDLEVLRKANHDFAIENADLRSIIDDLHNQLEGLENKWKCAVEMAAQAEVARDEALKLRGKWHAKWMTSRHECHAKIDALIARLDEIGSEA
jgi:hypothetical protein